MRRINSIIVKGLPLCAATLIVFIMVEYDQQSYISILMKRIINKPLPISNYNLSFYNPVPIAFNNFTVELTIRMPSTKKMVQRFMCDMLRSAVIFWKPNYGPIHIILDEGDVSSTYFPNSLAKASLPFQFRFYYEKEPSPSIFKRVSKRMGKPYGYIIQLYSTFMMDLYTNASVIAYTDSDTTFTQPVTENLIINNGRLIAKGMNSFIVKELTWLHHWEHTTHNALDLPQVSDFMTYFPVYMYPSTIKNCRYFIMKKFNVSTFEEAFEKFTDTYLSPVSVIMSYAYYFERDRYEWHLDIGIQSLSDYNTKRLPKYPLDKKDIQPETHSTIHTGYYRSKQHPLAYAICQTQIAIGLTKNECEKPKTEVNMQLFEFGNAPKQNHFETWCNGEILKVLCKSIIDRQYKIVEEQYKNGTISFDTSYIKTVEDLAVKDYGITCPLATYSPFS